MSDTPLTTKAVEKLKSMAAGNGIEEKDVVLLGTEEQVLNLRGEMHLSLEIMRHKSSYPGPLRNTQNVSAAKVQKVGTEAQADEVAKSLQEKMSKDGAWVKEAVSHLKEQPGEGWGIENADITLDDLAQLTYTQVNCTHCVGNGSVDCMACQGQGTVPCSYCRAVGTEPCINCNGTGVNAQNPGQYCVYCNGSTQQPCRQCRGTRQMSCVPCRGKAKITCQNCNGQGSFTSEDAQVPTAHARFHLVQSMELPSGFRRAMARGGLKSFTRGHGSVSMLAVEERDKTNSVVPYKAEVPFADVRLKIAGKAMRASVLGKKGVILDLPPFLDTALTPHITALEAAVSAPDSLQKVLHRRALKDAFTLLQQGRGDVKSLRGIYPAGLSNEMAARILKLVQKVMDAQTKIMRIVAGIGALVIIGGLSFLALQSGIRMGIATSMKPVAAFVFDILFCGLCVYAQNTMLRYVAAKQLQMRLGPAADAPKLGMATQKTGGVGIAVGVACVLIYLALLFVIQSAPSWSDIIHNPFG